MNGESHPRGSVIVDRSDHGGSLVLDATVSDGIAEVLDGTELAARTERRFGPEDPVVITSENVLDAVLRRLDDPARHEQITALKNKDRCRAMLAERYPDFFYRRVALADLPGLQLPEGRRLVVKPNRGYFATAVKIVDSTSDLAQIRAEIEAEVKRNAAVFADSVLSDAEVLVEDFLDGDEYAVDLFYDSAGEPVIVNIYHHPIPENPNYLHALYYSSKRDFDRLHEPLIEWFRDLNRTLGARRFPIHGEFRLGSGGLVPIELNPLRFGGDGLVELAYHAYGINPYAAFIDEVAPDWPAIWRDRADRIYIWMMGYVGTDVDIASHRPNIGAFQSLFANILSDSLLNYQSHLGFSVIYSEETDPARIDELVNTDFQAFFQGNEAFSEDSLEMLYRSGMRLRLAPGERVWEAGDIGDYALLVIEGALEVWHPSEDGTEAEFLLDRIDPRSVAGEYAVMDGRPRSAAVRAGPGGCVASKITGPAFRRLLREAPGLFEELYWQQQSRIRKMNKRIGALEAELAALRGKG
jgi:hypothetical protein